MNPVVIYHQSTGVFNEELRIVKFLQKVVQECPDQKRLVDRLTNHLQQYPKDAYRLRSKKGKVFVFKKGNNIPWIEVKTMPETKPNKLF